MLCMSFPLRRGKFQPFVHVHSYRIGKILTLNGVIFSQQGNPFGNFVGNICVTSPLSWKAACLCSAGSVWWKGIGAAFESPSGAALSSPVFSEELWSLQHIIEGQKIEFYMVRECRYSDEVITHKEQLCHFYALSGLVDYIKYNWVLIYLAPTIFGQYTTSFMSCSYGDEQ